MLIALLTLACATDPAPSIFDSPDGDALAIELAAAHLSTLPDASGEYVVRRVQLDDLGMAHVRVQQEYDRVPIFEGQAIVHLAADGEVASLTDKLHEDIAVDTDPLYEADEAIDLAIDETLGDQPMSADPQASLYVLRRPLADHLAWQVRLESLEGPAEPSAPIVWVDAHTGEILWAYDGLRHAATTGTGDSNYSGAVSLSIYEDGGEYYLEDTTWNVGTYTYDNTYSSLYYVTDTDTYFSESWQAEAVDAHYAGAATLAYYYEEHSLDGLDGSGGPGYIPSLTGSGDTISILVNYGVNYANGYWYTDRLVLGDGDGTAYGPLTSIDIVGHEMTHGVTENAVYLTYYDESGAIDEATADIFGAMIERSVNGESTDTWTVAEDIKTPSIAGDAERYMYDPTLDGASRDHYDDRYTGSSDNGGVHINNGIGNLAFYLMAEGGDHPTYGGTEMPGIGADAAAAIWYRALTCYFTSSTTFSDARTAMLSAATDLYGSSTAQYIAVQDAWALVGVGSASAADTCYNGDNGAPNHCTEDCPCPEGAGDCDSDDECDTGLGCESNNGADYDLEWYTDVCIPGGSCHPYENGHPGYCSETCSCAEGEGDCDSDAECDSGLTCVSNQGATYGLDWYTDICLSDCHLKTLGDPGYCTEDCTCADGEGDCDSDSECDSGLVCGSNNGAEYGLDWYTDVCTASCHKGDNGLYNYCTSDCPCDVGEGDCDSDAECDSGLTCGDNNGADYGLDWYVDVCE